MATCRDCGASGRWIHERKKADGKYALCNSCSIKRTKERESRRAAGYRKRGKVLKSRGNSCESCGGKDRLELHHKVRLVDGGDNSDENLIILCFECHRSLHKSHLY